MLTLADIRAKIDIHSCFQCDGSLGDKKVFVGICTDDGFVISVHNARRAALAPMVFCSSDCMVADCHSRFLDRLQKGTYRNHQELRLKKGFFDRWSEESPEICAL